MNSIPKVKFDPVAVRGDFPILDQKIHQGRPLVYLDNSASTQRPRAVIEAMDDVYRHTYANVHRGIHWLSERSTAQYEEARQKVQSFIAADHIEEIIFTAGTTGSINLVARAWGDANVTADDQILLTIMEHHSNIVPWQQLAERTGAEVRFVGLTDDGQLDLEDFDRRLSENTKIVAVSAISNVLGTVNDVSEVVAKAKSVGALVVVDAAQHVPHEPTDVKAWDADFVAFSGHKMLGPSGIGVLYGKQALLESMPPFMGGGSMISSVTTDGYTVGELPAKFEAGTPPIVGAIGFGAAIDYLAAVDMEAIRRHERELAGLCHRTLGSIDGLEILGPEPDRKAGIVSFVVDGCSPQDISILLDQRGIAIRAGHHCAMPLHDFLNLRNSCRASFYLYNTADDVLALGEALEEVVAKLR